MSTGNKIRFTTLQAPNQEFIIQEISSYVGERLVIPTEFIIDPPWQERERLLDAGEVQVAWICGMPYVWKVDQAHLELELLVAPVMQGARYQDRPVYFSDVIVRKESPYQGFEDLRGARWAYNEPNSHSGYHLTRYTLASMGERRGYFGSAVEAGSHQASIEMVIAGVIDAAAIDSTVLEIERDVDARIDSELRIITVFGPSPIPPLVISRQVETGLRAEIRDLLCGMHAEQGGRRILDRGKIKRFEVVKDEDYDLIREMAKAAQGVEL